jgi:hypothetical protein
MPNPKIDEAMIFCCLGSLTCQINVIGARAAQTSVTEFKMQANINSFPVLKQV